MKKLLSVMLLLMACSYVNAEEVKRQHGKLTVSAEYHKGDANKPMVILVHGFLTTRNSNTILSIADGLTSENYNVLIPTLSLGINNRVDMVACEAVHFHNMDDDIVEIDSWVQYAKSKGHKKIILVGHSFGSLQLVAYSAKYKGNVDSIIATSLVDSRRGFGEIKHQAGMIKTAKRYVATGDTKIHEFKLGYCDKYPSTAANYLSYAKWNKPAIIGSIKQADTKLAVIVGSGDKRVSTVWIDTLKKTGANIVTINGANHFFNGEHEFDLQDRILTLLTEK